MKISTTLTRVAVGLASAASVAQAWPSWMPPMDSLYVRQNNVGVNTAVASSSQENNNNDASSTIDAFTVTNQDSTATTSNNADSTATGTSGSEDATITSQGSSRSTSSRGSSNRNSTRTVYTDPLAQAGGMSMISPQTAAFKPLYKAGDFFTWEWNYTNIRATPTAIDLILSCSSITQSWTLTSNMTFATPATFVWDSSKQANDAQQPLVPNNYTLIIKDSEDSVTAAAEAGYLAVQSTFTFGVYTPAPYTPLADWECTTCIVGAASRPSDMVLPMVISSLLTTFGFMWFLNGLVL
ncbi:hypothetical protein CFIMG_003348RA [Ceratocystis fimbriata CBS 114723]|uniref:DUF7137 domain-containing protein n=1 Tax=Ceratocystis fimbriata CBS 114723 TaxID=1035309 RepID=A0A2C5X1W5_9PEZI|nr:hypothetical protein CFIMG_003348RA [Ceratocystis fimbriata CBS 114723]